ncbi:hypothetical protein ABIB25_005797 [Nakamurella sp. UYEF19]|uniref:hypothetical protein n=1 Tax=Nakamurella sp. UYEF19 TaxID=1756392 RepID=UPI0033947160
MTTTDELREHVRDRYAAAAAAVGSGSGQSCCGPSDALAVISEGDESDVFGAGRYHTGQTDGLPAEAVLASLGCGNPAQRQRGADQPVDDQIPVLRVDIGYRPMIAAVEAVQVRQVMRLFAVEGVAGSARRCRG